MRLIGLAALVAISLTVGPLVGNARSEVRTLLRLPTPTDGGRGDPVSVLDQRGALPRTSKAVVGLCWVALFLGACTIANTPQQDLAYARWAKCDSSFPVVLERVDLDGRITFWLSSARSQDVLQCLAEAGRTGPPLPEPLGVCPPKGP